MPVPIFYEYLLIDGTKMSASLGNVVYPREWKEVAKPELLKFLYNKRLMKTRTFSWTDLPTLYEDYKRHERIFYEKEKGKTEKETHHAKRLYELSQLEKHKFPLQLPFRLCTMIVQIFGTDADKTSEILKRTGHIGKGYDREEIEIFLGRIKRWVDRYAPETYKITLKDGSAKGLTKEQRKYLLEFTSGLKGEGDVKELCKDIMKQHNITAKEFFATAYEVLFGKDHGPRLAEFVEIYGRSKVADTIHGVLK
jgi:lysyl-tRNA synthetase class 1